MVEISNDEIAKLVALDAQFYIGMAAVDPRRPDAVQELERAFAELGLAGLAVNTARLKMYPMDERLVPLYDLCRKYHKPIIFHAGFCLENNALAKYARPMEFEEVAAALAGGQSLPCSFRLAVGAGDGGSAAQVPQSLRKHCTDEL